MVTLSRMTQSVPISSLRLGEIVVADLALAAEHSLRMHDGARADLGVSRYHDVREQPHAVPQNDVASDEAKGPISTPAPSLAPSSTIAVG